MTYFTTARIALPLVGALVLAGCDEAALTPRADGGVASSGEVTSETREVDRPDIFSATEEGLWDGRPSLGGVWVAHPDVSDPERVRITVPDSGRVVTGALFRRTRNNPGPRIQVSSDAAAALGMLAGQPTVLDVVVLRTETIEIAPPPEPEVVEEPEPEVAEPADAEATAGEVASAGAATAAATSDFVEAPRPARRSFWDRFRNNNRTSEVEADDTSEITAGADSSVEASAAATPPVETAPLDTVAVAAAAIDRAEAEAEETTTATPYVQIGLYNDETDATAATTALRQAGIAPIVKPLTEGSQALWRVLVGPALSDDAQQMLLARVKELGYSDAFAVAN